jgi:hypothetical protein
MVKKVEFSGGLLSNSGNSKGRREGEQREIDPVYPGKSKLANSKQHCVEANKRQAEKLPAETAQRTVKVNLGD